MPCNRFTEVGYYPGYKILFGAKVCSEQYEKWFNDLPQKHKMAIATDLKVLKNWWLQILSPDFIIFCKPGTD